MMSDWLFYGVIYLPAGFILGFAAAGAIVWFLIGYNPSPSERPDD